MLENRMKKTGWISKKFFMARKNFRKVKFSKNSNNFIEDILSIFSTQHKSFVVFMFLFCFTFFFIAFNLENFLVFIDEKTREEFISWMDRFPHLRIVGNKINFPVRSLRAEHVSNYEEIIAIDPPPHHYHESFKMLDQELNEKLSLRKTREPSANQFKVDDLEKLLRITSSSGLSRNHQQQNSKKLVDRTSTFIVKQQNSVGLNNIKKLSRIQEHKKFELTPITIIQRELDNKLSYSATSQPVKSIKSAQLNKMYADISNERQKIPKNEFSSKSASIHHHKKVNQNNIQLPPFNYDLDFPSFIQVRGYNNQKSRYMKH